MFKKDYLAIKDTIVLLMLNTFDKNIHKFEISLQITIYLTNNILSHGKLRSIILAFKLTFI